MRTRHAVSALGVLLASVAVLPFPSWAETYVLPVIVRGVAGLNGSYWDSEVRILQLNLEEPVTVKRLWVATATGGFVDDPTAAPAWDLPSYPSYRGLAILTGDDLLQGVDATHASIALEIQGNVAVMAHNTNSGGAGRLPPEYCCLPGNGQLTSALTAHLQGPSIIPWATSGKNVFRVNVGIVNPNPVSVTFHIRGESLDRGDPYTGKPHAHYWFRWTWLTMPDVVLPPWGWLQINDVFALLEYLPQPGWGYPVYDVLPASVIIEPVGGLPYYAYATPIYSPLNDPEFIAAIPITP